MSFVRKLACFAAGLSAMVCVAGANAAAPGVFTGGSYSCLEYMNGLGENSAGKVQSGIARLWIHGYLTGYFKGKGTLEFSEDPAEATALTAAIAEKCQGNPPQTAILSISLAGLASEPRKVPKIATGEFAPGAYTCGQHVEAKKGPAAKANAADLTELWAFAFVQGIKNVAQPDIEIRPEFKDPIVGNVNKVCGSSANKDKLFMDIVALVAEKVKIAE